MVYVTRPVERTFKDPNGVPKAQLSCGHVITDPIEAYGDQGALRDQQPGRPRRYRCRRCGETGASR